MRSAGVAPYVGAYCKTPDSGREIAPAYRRRMSWLVAE
jgi:hypothetical protein